MERGREERRRKAGPDDLKDLPGGDGPFGRLLLVEHVVPTDGEHSLSVLLRDLRMMVATKGGRERTAEEFVALLSASAFRLRRIVP